MVAKVIARIAGAEWLGTFHPPRPDRLVTSASLRSVEGRSQLVA
jgi:hypothetical protein